MSQTQQRKVTETVTLAPFEETGLRMVGKQLQTVYKLMWLGILCHRNKTPIQVTNVEHIKSNEYLVEYSCYVID